MRKKTKSIGFFALAFLSIAIFAIFYKYLNYRKAIFPYNVKTDYNYVFNENNVTHTFLKNSKLIIPDQIDNRYTAFIKIKVKANFLGKLKQPYLRIHSDEHDENEYFEDGVEGYRYVNISGFLEKGSKELGFEKHSIILEDQNVELSYFKKPNLKNANILVIATHPDDAEIAAYGLYSTYPSAFVLTVKSGESGDFKYDEVYSDTVLHYRKKGQLRTWNSITVPLLGGIKAESILNFGYFTELKEMFLKNPNNLASTFAKTSDIGTYRKQNISFLKDSLTGTANWNSLVGNFEFLVKYLRPSVIVTPYPALDRHQDHKYTTVALFEALRKLDYRDGQLFLYSNHYTNNENYPYGPSGGTMSLPPNFNNNIYFELIFSNSLSDTLQKDKLFALEAMNDLRPDTEWRFGKKSLIQGFQVAKTELLDGDPSYFRRALRSNELFFVVQIDHIFDDDIVDRIFNGNSKSGFTNGSYNIENYKLQMK